MKADCPRALESCIMKLASRTSGQRGWWGRAQSCWKRQGLPWGKQILGPAKQQPGKSEMGCGGERVGTAQPALGSCRVQRQPPQLWGCSNGDEKWLQRGLRWGAQHGRVPGSPSLVVLRCRQERQKLCVCRDRSRPAGLALQSHSAQSLCLAFREDLPWHTAMVVCWECFFTTTRLNHRQNIVISTPTWSSLTWEDLFL